MPLGAMVCCARKLLHAKRLDSAMADLPDGEELMHMLADSLGYTVTKS